MFDTVFVTPKQFDTVFVTPKSKKARNRFANLMGKDPECFVEQLKQNRLFLRSANGRNIFWVCITNDNDWDVEL